MANKRSPKILAHLQGGVGIMVKLKLKHLLTSAILYPAAYLLKGQAGVDLKIPSELVRH